MTWSVCLRPRLLGRNDDGVDGPGQSCVARVPIPARAFVQTQCQSLPTFVQTQDTGVTSALLFLICANEEVEPDNWPGPLYL